MPERLDFKAIAEAVDVMDVAQLLKLKVRNDRAACPGCASRDDRSLELLPETNSFRCHAATPPDGKKTLSGDCIALYAHLCGYTGMYRAAKELRDHFGAPSATAPATTPQKEKGRANSSIPARTSAAPFDAAAFQAKLVYSEEVEALGISEADAEALGIGFYRGRVYSALRYPSGFIAGFQYVDDEGRVTLPKSLLPDAAPNIRPFAKRA